MRREYVIGVRLSREQYQALARLARRDGNPKAYHLRAALTRYLEAMQEQQGHEKG